MRIVALLPPNAWLVLSALFFTVGEYGSKKFAETPNAKLLLLVCSSYMLGALAWLPAIMQTKQLSTTGMAWMLLSILATLGIGLGVFHEKVNSYQMAGIVLAIFALVLLNIER